GKRSNAVAVASLPQGVNGVKDFIPVARIADMLLHPGEPFDYNGKRITSIRFERTTDGPGYKWDLRFFDGRKIVDRAQGLSDE
ncbi:hypothetical protein SB758_39915, partial [Burkholderia sp. SIMBA_013]